jgi:NAD(P)-dependent dehydrogenase (short-subunit alcohol dehydrogenase family)/4-amino-4-deoxy-L-arabinose transferase-like glycosyltransferase
VTGESLPAVLGRPGRFPAIVFALAVLVPVVAYAALASRWIGAGVGYQVDEAIYVESAAFVLRGSDPPPYRYDRASWVATRGRRWPLMIIPYVGTAKAAVALPLFAVFGIAAPVARACGVLLGAIGIAGISTLLARRVHPAAGLAAGALLAVHPSFLAFTVFDNGGVSVWMASLGLLALAIDHHGRADTRVSAFLLGAAAGLGVWARMNFAWLVAAAAVAAVVVWRSRVLPSPRRAAALAAGLVLGSLPLLVYEAGSRLATLRFLPSARRPLTLALVKGRLLDLVQTLIADPEQRTIWAGPPPRPWEIPLASALFATVVAAALFPSRRGAEAAGRWRRAFATTALLLAGIMTISRLKISPHHLVGILPLVLAALAAWAAESASLRPRLPAAAAAAGLAFALLWLQRDVEIEAALRSTRGTRVWSSAVDDVRRHLRAHPVASDRLKIVSWGFQANLYVGSGGAVHGTELFWTGNRERSSRGISWADEIADGGTFLLYLFPTGDPLLDASAAGFQDALAKDPRVHRETTFLDRAGSPVARLVEIPRRAAAGKSERIGPMRIVVVGATGTIGSAVVRHLSPRHDVVAVSHSRGDRRVDIASESSIEAMYAGIGAFDALVAAAGNARFAPLAGLSTEDFLFSFQNKLMGQVNLVRLGASRIGDGGSFTLTSGVLASEPTPGSAAISVVNSGLEGFARAAALELPRSVRINVVSPPWISETLRAMGRDPAAGMPADKVARAYAEAIEGRGTGRVIDARTFA